YGRALRNTWELLAERTKRSGKKKAAFLDFGISACELWFPEGQLAIDCLSPKRNAPVLLPGTVELWSRTFPIPFADPEVSLYLHGPGSNPGDVEIVWRADLDDDADPKDATEIWTQRVAVCPPSSLEAIAVPIGEARNWLRGSA